MDGGASAPPLRPIEYRKSFNPDQVEDAIANVRHSLSLDLPQFRPSRTPKVRIGHTMCIVGGGPSLEDTMPTLRRLSRKPGVRIIAFNDAIHYLIGHGIIPWGSVFMEVAPWRPQFMERPPEGLTYMLASESHPETYEKMAGRNIIQWHADENIPEITRMVDEKFNGEIPLIPGGVTAASRAVFIGHAMGYRRFELFGLDSSHAPNQSHVYYDREGQPMTQIVCGGEAFDCPGYLARQADDFISIIQLHANSDVPNNLRMKIRVHGEGLLPHAARLLGVHADNYEERMQ